MASRRRQINESNVQEDLLEAEFVMRGRLESWPQFLYVLLTSHPYIYTLDCAEYEPAQWFRDQPQIVQGPARRGGMQTKEVSSLGKMRFMHDGSSVTELRELAVMAPRSRALPVRRGELGLEKTIRP